MTTQQSYPLHMDGTLDSHLSRGMWLIKWLLAVPHYIVLILLWTAYAVLSVVAFVAILFTGRYPRAIFDFNVGVLRWSWRVAYYAYAALGTDRYPPFTLADVPDYPAHLSVEYPEHLSRGLALVKWWLLALPHYLVVGLLVSGGWFVTYSPGPVDSGNTTWQLTWGLIGVLVFVAAVMLLFTGRYPRAIFDLVLGLNRWVLRVAAYASLMTDDYPPFRLDMGGRDPGIIVREDTPSTPTAPTTTDAAPRPSADAGPAGGTGPQGPRTAWTAGRVTVVVAGSVLLLIAGGLVTAGAAGAVVDRTQRDADGYLMTDAVTLAGPGHAIVSDPVRLDNRGVVDIPRRLIGDARIEVTSGADAAIFVGVAPSTQVDAYLAGVEHSVLTDFDGENDPAFRTTSGGAPRSDPTDVGIWTVSATGTGTEALTWPIEPGEWTVVVMNADAAPPVTAEVAAGATFPALQATVGVLLVGGGVLLLLSLGLVLGAVLTAGRGHVEPARQRTRS